MMHGRDQYLLYIQDATGKNFGSENQSDRSGDIMVSPEKFNFLSCRSRYWYEMSQSIERPRRPRRRREFLRLFLFGVWALPRPKLRKECQQRGWLSSNEELRAVAPLTFTAITGYFINNASFIKGPLIAHWGFWPLEAFMEKRITNSCFPQKNAQNSCLILHIHLPTEAFNFECLTSQESWFPFRPFKSTSVISILFQQATLQLSLIEDRKDSVCLRWHDQKSSSRRVFISPVLDPKVWAFIVIQVLYFTR